MYRIRVLCKAKDIMPKGNNLKNNSVRVIVKLIVNVAYYHCTNAHRQFQKGLNHSIRLRMSAKLMILHKTRNRDLLISNYAEPELQVS